MASSKDVIAEGYRRLTGAAMVVGLLSCVVNLLMLTGPLFMLQVYDRVLASQSIPTLVALVILVCGLYLMMGLFDFLRNRVLSRVSHWIDDGWSPGAFRTWLVRSLGGQAQGYRPMQDVTTLRGFVSSPLMIALFDLPWFPLFLGLVFLLSPPLGLLASAGAVVVICLALATELLTSGPAGEAARAEIAESRFTDQVQRNADAVVAMGMLGDSTRSWKELHDSSLSHAQRGAEWAEIFTAASKAFRMLLQSLILGYAAYLAILEQITPGMIVAASIITGRALAPIDQVVGGWRTLKRARIANHRLREYMGQPTGARPAALRLPDPRGRLELRNVTKYAPGSVESGEKRPILGGVSFTVQPGEGLGIIGPTGSGKSTLARLIVGLWMPDQGHVRIDGATFEQWDVDEIGRFIGYLPQQVELLPGTIAQNIARFRTDITNEDIVDAAKMAGVHELILGLPDGYGTVADGPSSPLTGGHRQRVGLARAIFRAPPLLVLDEPNSNLDADGDVALTAAIVAMRERGSGVVVMAHRPSAIAAVDTILMLKQGQMVEHGPKSEVLRKVARIA